VTQFHEENDEMMGEMSNMSLGNLKVQPESISSRIIIRKEDVQLIVTELEVPRFLAERKLIEHNGDVIAGLLIDVFPLQTKTFSFSAPRYGGELKKGYEL
jgi:NACalpha-BTF3-like transcription factor